MRPINFIFIDFEYNNTTERHLNVLCAAWEIWENGECLSEREIWFHGDRQKRSFKKEMQGFIDAGYIFVSWAAQAEASAFFSLGIHPYKKVKWFDLYIEYRMLTNHCIKYSCGRQLIAGKPRITYPPKPKWERTKADAGKSAPTEHNLAAAAYKMLDVVIDTDHKKDMRDLIIAGGSLTKKEQAEILKYCVSDVVYLPQLYQTIKDAHQKALTGVPKFRKLYLSDAIRRGDYAARSAVMERVGHPFDERSTKNFSSHINTILFQLSQEITESFPEIKPFLLDIRRGKFIRKEKNIQKWIRQNHTLSDGRLDWEITEKAKKPALSLDAFTTKYKFRHEFPSDNFGAQMVRFLKVKQALNGFLPTHKGKKNFWQYCGSDGRVRPYMGIFGAQSARSQPSSTSFIPLKASWMRVLIQPPPGYVYISVDYSSQEFLIGALLSKDRTMLRSYHSGDPYLSTAILAGAAPKGATRETHPEIRDKFKSTVLGIQYLMARFGLAAKLTQDTGVAHSEEEAQELINLFESSYPDYNNWRQQVVEDYRAIGFLRLPCGWIMYGNNPNDRSVANCPVQGTGSTILRKAVTLAQNRGLEVSYTLHDEVCVLAKRGQVEEVADKLASAMDAGFRFYFPEHTKRAATCGLGAKIWGPDFEEEGEKIETKWFPNQEVSKFHIDKRSIKQHNEYKKYFEYEDDTDFLMNLSAPELDFMDIL